MKTRWSLSKLFINDVSRAGNSLIRFTTYSDTSVVFVVHPECGTTTFSIVSNVSVPIPTYDLIPTPQVLEYYTYPNSISLFLINFKVKTCFLIPCIPNTQHFLYTFLVTSRNEEAFHLLIQLPHHRIFKRLSKFTQN